MEKQNNLCAKCQSCIGYYRRPNEEARYCGNCKTYDMINITTKICTKKDCLAPGYYGYPWDPNRLPRCFRHTIKVISPAGLPQEVMLLRRTAPCTFMKKPGQRCGKPAKYGFEGRNRTTRCWRHKSSDMIHLVNVYTQRYLRDVLGMPTYDKALAFKKVVLIEYLAQHNVSMNCC